MKVVICGSDWLRGVLKKAKMAWPKELVEHDDTPPDCSVSETGRHEWSRTSTEPFCVFCGKAKR